MATSEDRIQGINYNNQGTTNTNTNTTTTNHINDQDTNNNTSTEFKQAPSSSNIHDTPERQPQHRGSGNGSHMSKQANAAMGMGSTGVNSNTMTAMAGLNGSNANLMGEHSMHGRSVHSHNQPTPKGQYQGSLRSVSVDSKEQTLNYYESTDGNSHGWDTFYEHDDIFISELHSCNSKTGVLR